MKQISIIISINQIIDSSSTKDFSIATITDAFSRIDHELRTNGFEYEIILGFDSETTIKMQDIEIFPLGIPVKFFKDNGQSNLITQGLALAQFDYIGILGSTWGYLPQMLKKIVNNNHYTDDVVAALKTTRFSSLPFLFKMRINPQNASLFFSKSVWDIIHFQAKNESNFFIEFLKRSQEAGFRLKKYRISSHSATLIGPRNSGMKAFLVVVKDIIMVSLKKLPPIYIPAQSGKSMVNAGLFYKKQKYVTHTTLNVDQSALEAIDMRTVMFCLLLICFLGSMLVLNPLLFIQCIIGFISCIYLIDVGFNIFLVGKAFQKSSEISFTEQELKAVKEHALPIYSILCPLYKEAHILPQFIKGLEKLDWPKDKLDVIILLESDDTESINAFHEMSTPSYIRAVVVPNSIPKTKPKACNYGLAFAQGEYTVIYDAEDIPDPMQLKKAYLGFKKEGKNVACLQAKLNYYNVHQNWLTRFFTAEYSLWFGITLTSLHSLNTVIPLGGTSNHFRTEDLRTLHAWDPFNVTEDADLGLRLFKLGYRTAILDSVTLEEGNSELKNWIRQRSRWIKGYMQTYLVHTKENLSFFKERGVHALIFHLLIGGKIAFIIINPILWIVTLLYFIMYGIVGPTIDSFYPPFVLYVAITSLIFGNFLYLFCHLMGCVKNEQWSLIKYVYFIPFYWVLISIAGFMALYQLIFNPFYWEKTVHGLHLKNNLTLS